MSDLPLPKTNRSFPFVHETVLAVAVIALLAVAYAKNPVFIQLRVQLDPSMAGELWPLALLALPMTLIIITGGIDLSVGSITALCAMVLGVSIRAGHSPAATVGLTLLVGTSAGALNGWIAAWMRVHPLIVTLATMSAFRGIALAVGGAESMQVPNVWKQVVRGDVLGLPYPLIVIGLLAVLAGLFLWRTSYGRFAYAIGHNATASRFSGVPVQAIRFWLFTFSGLCCGLASILIVAQHGQAKADAATGLELGVITAVVLGGVSIFGGRGSIAGVALGVLLIHLAQRYVSFIEERSELTPLVVGGLLIGSVLINSLVTRRGRSGRG